MIIQLFQQFGRWHMSFDKAIEHKKEKRKQYSGAKAIDKSCRNHGSCQYCYWNRMHKHKIAELKHT